MVIIQLLGEKVQEDLFLMKNQKKDKANHKKNVMKTKKKEKKQVKLLKLLGKIQKEKKYKAKNYQVKIMEHQNIIK